MWRNIHAAEEGSSAHQNLVSGGENDNRIAGIVIYQAFKWQLSEVSENPRKSEHPYAGTYIIHAFCWFFGVLHYSAVVCVFKTQSIHAKFAVGGCPYFYA